MIQLFQKHILKNFSFLQSSSILIASSGGIDSVVLTDLMMQLELDSKIKPKSITIAHCNFQLRGRDSDLDENFVENEGAKRNIPVLINHFNTENHSKQYGVSIQMAARDLRYQWFEELIQKHGFDYVLTAHHADDCLETFLINLTRGTGLDGLTGIPSVNHKVIRPLLIFTREQIEHYAIQEKLDWREDKSNSETKYLRNKFRHIFIPSLKEINSNFMSSFAITLQNLQGSQQIIKESVANLKKEIVENEGDITKIHIDKIKNLSNPKAYLYELLKEYGFTEWNDLSNLLTAQSGKQIYSHSYRLLKDRSYLLLTKKSSINKLQKFIIDVNDAQFSNFEIKLKLGKGQYLSFDKDHNNIVFIDKALLKFPLTVRKWEKGDYFYPIGMTGRKKVSKYFKDEKLSILEKEKTWLLCTSKNEVIWIIDKRLDNRFKITDSTTEILRIEYE